MGRSILVTQNGNTTSSWTLWGYTSLSDHLLIVPGWEGGFGSDIRISNITLSKETFNDEMINVYHCDVTVIGPNALAFRIYYEDIG